MKVIRRSPQEEEDMAAAAAMVQALATARAAVLWRRAAAECRCRSNVAGAQQEALSLLRLFAAASSSGAHIHGHIFKGLQMDAALPYSTRAAPPLARCSSIVPVVTRALFWVGA